MFSDDVSIAKPDVLANYEGLCSEYRTVGEVYDIALNATKLLESPQIYSRSVSRSIDINQPVKTVYKAVSRSGSAIPLYYVVNYADSMGFAVVSGHKNAPELICVTEDGSYDPYNPDDHADFNRYMEVATDYLSDGLWAIDTTLLRPGGSLVTVPEKTVKDTTLLWSIPRRIQAYWGQRDPEGNECPNGTCGCTITAAAIMMTYFQEPKSLELTYLPHKPTIPLNWDAFKFHRSKAQKDACDRLPEDSVHLRLAQMCREFGYRCYSIYNDDGTTGTYTSYLILMLEKFGYKYRWGMNLTNGSIANHLDEKSILLVNGRDTKTDAGHMWVCDAAFAQRISFTRYITKNNGLTWIQDGETTYREDQYNYFNWGWGYEHSKKCGYYLDMTFNPKGTAYDYANETEYLKVWRDDK